MANATVKRYPDLPFEGRFMNPEQIAQAGPRYRQRVADASVDPEISRQENLEILKRIQKTNELLDETIETGRAKLREQQRAIEDTRLQGDIQKDRETRDKQAGMVDSQTAEYLMPKGTKAVLPGSGIYQTAPATTKETRNKAPGASLGSFSNIGVIPGRTYGDFRKEREFERQLQLAGVKAGDKKTAYDEGIIKQIDRLAEAKGKLNESVIPEDQKQAKMQDFDKQIANLQSELSRRREVGVAPGSTLPQGYTRDMGGAPQTLFYENPETPSPPPTTGPSSAYTQEQKIDFILRTPNDNPKKRERIDAFIAEGGDRDALRAALAASTTKPPAVTAPAPGMTQNLGVNQGTAEQPATQQPVKLPPLIMSLAEPQADTPQAQATRRAISSSMGSEGLKRAQAQFNADVKGGIGIDESLLKIAKMFGKEVADLIRNSLSQPAPEGTVRRTQYYKGPRTQDTFLSGLR